MKLIEITLGMFFWIGLSFAIIAAMSFTDRMLRLASALWRRKIRNIPKP